MNVESIAKSGARRNATKAEISSAAPSTPVSNLESLTDGEAARRARRDSRKPFGAHVQKLAYPKREGYHRHWFNDTPGRIMSAIEAGYEHVLDPVTGQKVSRPVGVNEAGGALIAYIMEIPQEWYNEDMAKQQAEIDEREHAMRHGADSEGQPGKDGRYIPSQGIKIETNKTN